MVITLLMVHASNGTPFNHPFNGTRSVFELLSHLNTLKGVWSHPSIQDNDIIPSRKFPL